MSITETAHGMVATPPVWSDDAENLTIPIDLATTTAKLLYRAVLPATVAGDVLDISFKAGFTNNAGVDGGTRYTVGVGCHVWYYDYNDGAGFGGRVQIADELTGDNVDPTRHHLPMAAQFVWRVPADWPEGHRMVLCLLADAHSTAWQVNGGHDVLDVEAGYGQIAVRRWTLPAPEPAPEQCAPAA